jgi:signal transduction histidine kinase
MLQGVSFALGLTLAVVWHVAAAAIGSPLSVWLTLIVAFGGFFTATIPKEAGGKRRVVVPAGLAVGSLLAASLAAAEGIPWLAVINFLVGFAFVALAVFESRSLRSRVAAPLEPEHTAPTQRAA